MKKSVSKLMALMLIIALVSSFAAFSASAESSQGDITTGTITIDAYLVLEGTEIAPLADLNFTIANGTAVTENDKMPILAGKLNESITKTVQFTYASPVTKNFTSTNSNLNGKNVAVETITINELTAASLYSSPGIYRYTVTEGSVASPLSFVGTNVKYIDVYVEYPLDDTVNPPVYSTTLTVTKAILHDVAVSYANSNGTASNSAKTAVFINSYATNKVDFSKKVKGNQGDKNKFFTFTVKAAEGSAFHLTDRFIINFNNGAYYHEDNNYTSQLIDGQYYVTGTQLNTGFKILLKDTSDVEIVGLPSNLSVTITESPEDYTPSFENVSGTVTQGTATATVAMSGNASVPFVNTKGGTVPTGVLLTVAPFAIGLLLFGAVGITMLARKKEEE